MKTLINIVVAAVAATTPLFSIAQSPESPQLIFGYCGNITRGLGTADQGTIERGAIEIPRDLAQKWAGNSVTKVIVGYGSSSISDISVFFTKSLEDQPLYSQDYKVQNQLGWNTVELDSPYEITGEPFYVGYGSLIGNANDKPIGIDDIKNSNQYSSWIEINGDWRNYSTFFGNVCIRIVIEGDNLPMNEVVLDSASAPQLVKQGDSFSVSLEVTNLGASPIKSISPQYKINGVTAEVGGVSFPDGEIASQQSGRILLSGLVCETVGRNIPLEISLGLINGEVNESQDVTTASVSIDCAEICYHQAIVVEEFTGTWCGWCPLGIVGMKYMEDNYGDKGFIGIAVHYGDEMSAQSYAPLALKYYSSPGFPSAIANRGEVFDPSEESLLQQYNDITAFWAPAVIEVSSNYNEEDNTLIASATTQYSFDWTDSPYKVAFVITENNVGPYLQDNNFSGGQLGETLEGWTDKPFNVLTFYDEVARDITDLYGIEGSVPSAISAQTPYTYSTELPLENIADLSNCRVIALIIDSEGKIVNGAKTSIEGLAGIKGIEPNAPEKIRVYNLYGVKLLETEDNSLLKTLAPGFYIVNGKKIMIK